MCVHMSVHVCVCAHTHAYLCTGAFICLSVCHSHLIALSQSLSKPTAHYFCSADESVSSGGGPAFAPPPSAGLPTLAAMPDYLTWAPRI